MCRIDSSGMSKWSSMVVVVPVCLAGMAIVAGCCEHAETKEWGQDPATSRGQAREDDARDGGEERVERVEVGTQLGAKEWRNVYPSRHQPLLVRRGCYTAGITSSKFACAAGSAELSLFWKACGRRMEAAKRRGVHRGARAQRRHDQSPGVNPKLGQG